MEPKKEYGPRVKVGGLWMQKTKAGQVWFSGDFGGYAQIQIWQNQKRPDKPNDPDFTMYICEKQKKDASAVTNTIDYLNNFMPTPQPVASSFPTYVPKAPEIQGPVTADDLPF